MRAGAKEFLARPLKIEDLLDALNRLADRRVGKDHTKSRGSAVIAVAGACGGVGSTSIAVNLACSLAKDPDKSVALIDLAKGIVPVAILGPWSNGPGWFMVALGLAAVLGHMYSPYVRFKGGKGVATAAGMFLALAPLAIVLSMLVWTATLWLSGYVSVASLAAAVPFPLWVRLTVPRQPYTLCASVILALLIVYAHRANIRRLRDGTENRFRTRKGVTV